VTFSILFLSSEACRACVVFPILVASKRPEQPPCHRGFALLGGWAQRWPHPRVLVTERSFAVLDLQAWLPLVAWDRWPTAARHFKDGMSMDDIAPKSDLNHNHNHEGSCSSSVSTPEPDGEAVAQDASQRQKRKGGRKPVCSVHGAEFFIFLYSSLRDQGRTLTCGDALNYRYMPLPKSASSGTGRPRPLSESGGPST
jgi:hypothetical protein